MKPRMVADDERREVARRLRETGEELGSTALLRYHIAKILGVRTATDGKTACDMLADLIEPGEPSGHECVPGECSLNVRHDSDFIDRDALLSLADELEEDACWEVQTPGDASGAWRLKDACDRIREALGVEP